MSFKTKNIRKWNYGNYSSNNYGFYTMGMSIGKVTFWFSYDTVVAFREDGHSRRVRENDWSTTTGKHINWIDGGDKKSRIPSDDFEKELNKLLKKYRLVV
tara:strand:- start:947 stop:1246 length:300 start_codon:yes stop_codon:yes gene_type:complete